MHKRNKERQSEGGIENPAISDQTSHTQDLLNSLHSDEIDLDPVNALPTGSETLVCGNEGVAEIRPAFTPTCTGNVTGTEQTSESTLLYRCSSLKNSSGFSDGKGHHSTFLPHPRLMRVSFDQTVSFVTVPPLSELCPKCPERLFYTVEDFAFMKELAGRDAEKIRQVSKSKASENDTCDLGIEHRTCSAKERFVREVKARAVILSVLRAQNYHRREYSAADSNSAQAEIAIAEASMGASNEAIIHARERAAQLEGQCSSSQKGVLLPSLRKVPPSKRDESVHVGRYTF